MSEAADSLARKSDTLKIFSFHNIAPDNLGCMGGMYSRSSDSILVKAAQVTSEKSYSFYDRFYHNYGHRSLGDMSMPNFAIEGITELEALFLTGIRKHRSRWNGQQRSTRYQDFTETGFIVPGEVVDLGLGEEFSNAADRLFTTYQAVLEDAEEYYRAAVQKPPSMSEAEFERTLRARSFDVARYLLPLCTATSVFQITSARTLEDQISELLSSSYPRVRRLGERLIRACHKPSIDPKADRVRGLVETLRSQGAATDILAEIDEVLSPVLPAPTLVKYTSPDQYWLETLAVFSDVAAELLADDEIDLSKTVDLVMVQDPRVEFLAKILYQTTHHSFRQVVEAVSGLSESRQRELLDLAFAHRSPHDEWLPESRTGLLNFDILMDVGGYRDLHRHRRCEQYLQPLDRVYGYVRPDPLEVFESGNAFDAAIRQSETVYDEISQRDPRSAPYLLTMAHRCRSLFSMDLAEVAYLTELRTKPSGHFSYRRVAYEMYEAVRATHPDWAHHMRVTSPDIEDLLWR